MGAPAYGAVLLFALALAMGAAADSAPQEPTLPSTAADAAAAAVAGAGPGAAGAGISSNSVLVALLDSHYTELSELVEKALLLQTLEDAVGRHNVTIFAPRNEALERDLDPEFKRFLLEPRNLRSLQSLLLFHVLPARHPADTFPSGSFHPTLSGEDLELAAGVNGSLRVAHAAVTRPDAVLRPDGVIHGIERLLVPRSVQEDFNRRRSLAAISAVLPTGAPEVDPRTHRLKKPAPPVLPGAPPVLPVWDAMAPGPSIAPAPAPGPGNGKSHFDGHSQVKDFIQTLVLYGGYNELADILVNLTSLATEMGRLVSEGYVLTVLAPNDEAMARLTTDQLSEPGSPENILYYHMIPEYQTEESMYNAVRRFGKVRYDTLRLPHKVVAREADGSVKFGQGEGSAYLFDPDIYTDGRISVQGIDAVLLPEDDTKPSTPVPAAPARKAPAVTGSRRSKLRRGKSTGIGKMDGNLDMNRNDDRNTIAELSFTTPVLAFGHIGLDKTWLQLPYFASNFLTLQSMAEKKDALRAMVVDTAWEEMPIVKSKKGKDATATLSDGIFWKGVALCLKVFEPLVSLLRLVDGDVKPSMPWLYGELLKAKIRIKEAFGNNPHAYKESIAIIDKKLKGRLDTPLHKTAYLLNPYYSYTDKTIFDDASINEGFMECAEQFYKDDEKALTEMVNDEFTKFEHKDGLFKKKLAECCVHADYNPVSWWKRYGSEVPILQKMAIRILALTSSSSGCERNWSIFEQIHTKRRNRLTTDRLNNMVYIQFNQRMMSKKQRLKDKKKADTLLSNDASEAQGWLYEGGDAHAFVVFRDGEDEDQDVGVHAATGIPYDVLGEAMGAQEQLQHRRSARNMRDLEEEEFDSANEEMIEDDVEYESDY